MRRLSPNNQNRLLVKLYDVAKQATKGPWVPDINESHQWKRVIKLIPEEHTAKLIAECMTGSHNGFRSFHRHIRLFETVSEADAVYIYNFNPERAKIMIKNHMNLASIISEVSRKLDQSKPAVIERNLLKIIHDIVEMNSFNTQLDNLLKLTEKATPGPYMLPKRKGKSYKIVQTFWKCDLNKYAFNENGKRMTTIKSGENFGFKYINFKGKDKICLCERVFNQSNNSTSIKHAFNVPEVGGSIQKKILSCATQENQHNDNVRFIANFHPTVAVSLIEKIMNFQEILIKVLTLPTRILIAALGEDLVNKIHDAIEMSKE